MTEINTPPQGTGEPVLTNLDNQAIAELQRVREMLHAKAIHPLTSQQRIFDAIKLSSNVLFRLDERLSAVLVEAQRMAAKRNGILRAIEDAAQIFETRFGKVYSVARARADYNNSKKNVRKEVLSKCNGVCPACGEKRPLTVDHIVPILRGGTNTMDNLQALCRACNSRKGSRK